MARWYVGKERAALLLRFAEGELARYAYSVPADLYRSVLKILQTQIPLWAEERRGPLDRNGVPLYSYDGYTKFIKWWIAKMLSSQGGNTTMKVKGSWVSEIFDPIANVVGKKKLGGAVALTPGGGGVDLNLPPIESLIGNVNIGKKTAARLYAEGIAAIYEMTNALRTAAPGQAATINKIIDGLKQWLQPLTSSWQNESRTPLDIENYPNPQGTMGTVPMATEAGTGVLDRIRQVMQQAIYYALKQAVVGPQDLPLSLTGTGVKLPSQRDVPYGQLGAQYAQYLSDPSVKKGSPDPHAGYLPFAQLVRERGDDMIVLSNTIESSQGAYSFSQINHALNEVLSRDKYQASLPVGVNNSLTAEGQSAYQQLLFQLGTDVESQLEQ